jgi:hypothetical protein
MARFHSERRGRRSTSTDLVLALVLASALPCGALLWPGKVPHEIVVLSLIAWVGIFVVVLSSARTEDRGRRQGRGESAAGQRLRPRA